MKLRVSVHYHNAIRCEADDLDSSVTSGVGEVRDLEYILKANIFMNSKHSNLVTRYVAEYAFVVYET